ncbi:hypothetical protein AKN94_05550 [Thiopseudomonas alkaliphila]|uniref:glycosyltransferase n=1 Tax=Thiopseudomonas alkaliphila TaxID=1697053 RepID=UPI00069CE2ED|nr:glycosyltransferase [Thiopseudomonas alkaliphila]AKX46880.1 hypothetical protein AKN94_05550 [Thiopseudomonas alkaliphila]
MSCEVIFVSRSLSLSGSTTWMNTLIKVFQQMGIPCRHIVVGRQKKIESTAHECFYTEQPRRLIKFKIMRLFQVHKLFKKFFSKKEDDFYNEQIARYFKNTDTPALVIKDFSAYLPSFFQSANYKVIAVLHHQHTYLEQNSYYDHLVAVSQGIMDNSRKLGYQVEKVIYNPVNSKEICDKSTAYTVDESNYIIYVGRLHQEKGVYELIQAYYELLKEGVLEKKLVFVGEGKAKEKLEAYVKDREIQEQVVFKGFLKNPYPYIKKASLLVLPSYSEAMGYVAIEAGVLNTSYLVSDYPAAQEFFPETNIFIKGETQEQFIKSLKNKIIDLLDNPQVQLKNNIVDVMKPEIIAEQYMEFM